MTRIDPSDEASAVESTTELADDAVGEVLTQVLGGGRGQPELLALFDVLVDVIFCAKDPAGRYVAVNPAFVRRTGRPSKGGVLGRRASEVFPAAQAERYEAQDDRVLTTGEPLRDELELIRREGGSLGWYLTTKLPVVDPSTGGVTGLVSVSRDLRTPEGDDVPASLARVVEHVRANLSGRITVADLATAAECSPSQLDRRMRRTFGLSPSKYLLRVRVDRATELLTTTDLPLAEVAAAAGFYDQADFTRRFARLIDETPGQFRAAQHRLRGSVASAQVADAER